ncbi:hypothetical protein FGB62_138g021 [Gracilaria domingensis]|nr:hypothetical protein FGB62_138g021 [Gracilaria domingensis]
MGAMHVWIGNDRRRESIGGQKVHEGVIRVSEEEDVLVQIAAGSSQLIGDTEGLSLTLRANEHQYGVQLPQTGGKAADGKPSSQPLLAEEGALAAIEDEHGGETGFDTRLKHVQGGVVHGGGGEARWGAGKGGDGRTRRGAGKRGVHKQRRGRGGGRRVSNVVGSSRACVCASPRCAHASAKRLYF